MNLAAIDWLSISINLLLVVFVIVCLLMILLILMQRPKQEGLGAAFGAGVTDQVFGARTTNVLQRGTVYLGSMFFILALILAVLIGHKNQKTSMLDAKKPAAKVETAPPATPPEGPAQPKSLSDELPAEVTIPGDAPAPQPPPEDGKPPAGEPATPPAGEPAIPPAGEPATPPAAPAGNASDSEEKSGEP